MLCPSIAAAAAAAALLKEGPTVAKQAASSSCLNDAPLPVTPSVTTSLHEIGLQTSKNWLQHPLQPLKCDPCTRQPAGSMHKCEPESSNPEIEPSWKRREGCCSRGGSSWRQRRHAALDVGSREEPRRYATVLREVAGQDPPAV